MQNGTKMASPGAKIIRPPRYSRVSGNLIFLIGPIQGAPDWQSGAIEYLKHDSNLTIASPRRTETPNPFTDKDFYEQMDWEHFYIWKAMKKTNGVFLCWFAKEEDRTLTEAERADLALQLKRRLHVPRRAYAQTSRFEIAMLAALSSRSRAHVVLGIENGFSGKRYLEYTLIKKFPRVHLCTSFDETCRRALELSRAKRKNGGKNF